MNFEQVLIAILTTALIAAVVNLYSYLKDRRRSETKRRLGALYYPLHAILAKKNKYVLPLKSDPDQTFEHFAIEYYKIFLALQNRYLDNKMYESPRLARAFHALMQGHGIDANSENRNFYLPREVIRNLALFELNYQKDESGISQIERHMQFVERVVNADIAKMIKRGVEKKKSPQIGKEKKRVESAR